MTDYSIQVGDTSIELTGTTNSVAVYNLTADVIRDTKVNSSEGVAVTPVVLVNDMLCAIKWLSGRESLLFNKQTHMLDGILKCRVPAGVTVTNTDRILYNSEYYDIVDVLDVNNLGVLLEIALRKVK